MKDRGIHTWDERRDLLARPATSSSRSKKRSYPIASSRIRALPDGPGVYRFLRSNGELLYVGKATSLRKRVASHFGSGFKPEQALEMLTQASDVHFTRTVSSLEAALLENETIKTLGPPYNVQLSGQDPRVWFTSSNFDGAVSAPDATYRIGPVPSKLSLDSIAALVALRSGEPPKPLLRARAVGAPAAWAPDEAAFAAGFTLFAARNPAFGSSTRSARRCVLDTAKRLVPPRVTPKLDDELGENGLELDVSAPSAWDPKRVARHLERALFQAYTLFRRSRWLCILYDSVVEYREAGGDRTCVLVVREGEIVDARDLPVEEPLLSAWTAPPHHARQRAFDRSKYDRLRILTTELRRIRRDDGHATIHIDHGRRLREALLDGILRRV